MPIPAKPTPSSPGVYNPACPAEAFSQKLADIKQSPAHDVHRIAILACGLCVAALLLAMVAEVNTYLGVGSVVSKVQDSAIWLCAQDVYLGTGTVDQ